MTLLETGSTERTFDDSSTASFLQTLDLNDLKMCLRGVASALGDTSAGNRGQADADLSTVSSACIAASGGAGSGPAYPFDFPDPFILPAGGVYFAYATNSTEGNIQILESSNLSSWQVVGNALPSVPSWANPNFTWAPAVLPLDGRYVLYYTVSVKTFLGGLECISDATASQPEGPFVDSSQGPLECQSTLGGSIDPSTFVASDGTPYLQWKSNGGSGQPATIWSQQLSGDGTALIGSGPSALLRPDRPWQGGIVEAPDLVEDGGRYWLLYAGNKWETSRYAVGAASCQGPLGPCTDGAGSILSSGSDMAGPGGPSVFFDHGGDPWIAIAAWLPGSVGYPNSRELFLRGLDLSGAVPVVAPAG